MTKIMVIAAMATIAVSNAQAAELKLLVAGSMEAPFREVGAQFAKSTGNKIEILADTTGGVMKRMEANESADIVLVSAQAMQELEHRSLVVPGTTVALASAAIGVSVRAGAAAPDLSTPEAFRRAMLGARRIALVDPKAGGTSGIYLDGLFKRMGISNDVRNKAVLRNRGSEVADAVASGEAELGLTFISEMAPNKGIRIAGPLPDAIQNATVYSVAIPATSAHKDEARAFVAAIAAPNGQQAIRSAALTPLLTSR